MTLIIIGLVLVAIGVVTALVNMNKTVKGGFNAVETGDIDSMFASASKGLGTHLVAVGFAAIGALLVVAGIVVAVF